MVFLNFLVHRQPLSAASATSGNGDDQSNASASGQDAMTGTSATNTSQSTKIPSVKLADIASAWTLTAFLPFVLEIDFLSSPIETLAISANLTDGILVD